MPSAMNLTETPTAPALTLSRLPALLRFGNWWHYKIPPLIAIYFFALAMQAADMQHQQGALQVAAKLLLLIIWMLAAASFGYFVNDWSDIEEDRRAGKKNEVAGLSVPFRWLIVINLLAVALAAQAFLNGLSSISFCLSVLQLLLFVLYSVRPVRLKKYLLPAVVCDSLYAHVLPAAIVFASVYTASYYLHLLLLLCGWQLVSGIRNILLHHLFDRKHDAMSGNTNLANRFGPAAMLNVINRFLLPLDLVLVLAFFSFVSVYLVYVFVALVLFRLFLVKVAWRIKKLWSNKKMSYWLLNDVYEGYIPFVAILLFSLSSLKIFIVLCMIYPLVFPQFLAGLDNDRRHLYYYLKSISR